jgi:hypothetical protein
MKQFTLALCATSILFFSCNNEGKNTDTSKTDSATSEKTVTGDAAPPAMPDSATRAKNWQAYMTPGEMHKMMDKWNGNWDADATFWAPGKPEMKSKSSVSNKMLFDGRYQETTFSGDMMGMPFLGKSTTAYDNHKKQFKTTWIDNMGSGMMVMEGPWDETSQTMNLKGKTMDPETGYEMDARETFKIIDDNTQEMEMFLMMPDGKEFKMMNIRFTRKK